MVQGQLAGVKKIIKIFSVFIIVSLIIHHPRSKYCFPEVPYPQFTNPKTESWDPYSIFIIKGQRTRDATLHEGLYQVCESSFINH